MDKIQLKEISTNDIDFLYEIRIEYVKYVDSIGGNEKLPSFEQHKNFVEKFINNNNEHQYQKWYIILFNGIKVGSIPLKKDNEFGYQIQKEFQGKHICQSGIELFFKNHNKQELWAKALEQNSRSNYLLKKWGFKKERERYVFKNI